MRLTEEDHARVTSAVAAAEAKSDGEIVTIVAPRSDAYHDAALHWCVMAMLLVLALFALVPSIPEWLHARIFNPWEQGTPTRDLFVVAAIASAVTFLIARVVFAWDALRLLLTPGSTKTRRVHRRAMILFRTAAESRTRASTGVLVYLSIAERRAEIIADAAIHSKVEPEVWGAAMAALIAAVRDGRPGDGMAEAVAQIGAVLAEHFPRSADDSNELPDRLIEL